MLSVYTRVSPARYKKKSLFVSNGLCKYRITVGADIIRQHGKSYRFGITSAKAEESWQSPQIHGL